MLKFLVKGSIASLFLISMGMSQAPVWSDPTPINDIQVYAGDGTSTRPPVVKVGIAGTGYAWKLNDTKGNLMYQAALTAFAKGASVRIWSDPCTPCTYLNSTLQAIYFQNPIGTWQSANTRKGFDIIIQNGNAM